MQLHMYMELVEFILRLIIQGIIRELYCLFQNWIGNQRGNCARRTETAPSKQTKKVQLNGPSAYNLFCGCKHVGAYGYHLLLFKISKSRRDGLFCILKISRVIQKAKCKSVPEQKSIKQSYSHNQQRNDYYSVVTEWSWQAVIIHVVYMKQFYDGHIAFSSIFFF